MNLDFHYYASNLAARFAGFSKEEALIISKSAEFVDYYSREQVIRVLLGKSVATTTQDAFEKYIDESMLVLQSDTSQEIPAIFTAMGPMEAFIRNRKSKWTGEDQQAFKDIWMAFHFLPGNELKEIKYDGPQSNGIGSPVKNWRLSEKDLDELKYICRPCSIMLENLINDTKNHRLKPNYLYLIGIRMHTLADSWAHQNFMGLPRWFANNISNNEKTVTINDNGNWREASFHSIPKNVETNCLDDLDFLRTPTMPSYESISYLGHARMGLIPDLGYLDFSYKPNWSKVSVRKTNPLAFSRAFHQMYYALKCIKEGKTFDRYTIPSDFEDQIISILQTKAFDQSQEWNSLIFKHFEEEVSPFDHKSWLYRNCIDHLVNFTTAAQEHLNKLNAQKMSYFSHRNDALGHSHSSSQLCFSGWDHQQYIATCIDGQMVQRLDLNGSQSFKVDDIQYCAENGTRWRAKIDQQLAHFLHYQENETTLYYETNQCHYLSGFDKRWTSTIINEHDPISE